MERKTYIFNGELMFCATIPLHFDPRFSFPLPP